jgi:hypothetical protein
MLTHGTARRGVAWQGTARQGRARQGIDQTPRGATSGVSAFTTTTNLEENITMKIPEADHGNITAVLVGGFWYNTQPGSFHLTGEDAVPVGDAIEMFDVYEFLYSHRTRGSGLRMSVRDDLISAVQFDAGKH